jgi:hypothetical protein
MIFTHPLKLCKCLVLSGSLPLHQKDLVQKRAQSSAVRTYLHLNHEASLSPQLDDITINVYFALGFQAFQHGVDSNVGSGASHASTEKANIRMEAASGQGSKWKSCPA